MTFEEWFNKEWPSHDDDANFYGSEVIKEAWNASAERYRELVEEITDELQKMMSWCNAYPIEVFPEPDFKKAAKVLKDNGMTLDSISASNMRHVLKGLRGHIEAALEQTKT